MFLVLCHIIQTDPDSPRTRNGASPGEQPTPEDSAGGSKTINPPIRKIPSNSREIQRRHREKKKRVNQETAKERDLFKDKAQNLQDQNEALENASKLQQQKIAYLESHLRDAHGKMAALSSRLKESEETAWVIDQNQAASSLQQQKIDSLESQLQIAHETIAALESRLKESEKTAWVIDQNQAASSLQQRKIEFLGSHNATAAIRESEKSTQAIDALNTDLVSQTAKTVQFSNSWREQEITLLKIQNSHLLEILKDAVRNRK
jgi:predicted RNase H-like nuclease (RuvC/YqgF family)